MKCTAGRLLTPNIPVQNGKLVQSVQPTVPCKVNPEYIHHIWESPAGHTIYAAPYPRFLYAVSIVTIRSAQRAILVAQKTFQLFASILQKLQLTGMSVCYVGNTS